MKLKISKFRKKQTGNYISILNNDIYLIESDFFSNFFDLITNLLSVIFSVVLIGIIDARITFLLGIVILSCSFVPNLLGKEWGH